MKGREFLYHGEGPLLAGLEVPVMVRKEDKGLGKVKIRGFEVVADWARECPDKEIILPHRATQQSAGYDFYAIEDTIIPPQGVGRFATDVKAYMLPDEVLHIYPRSSVGIKRGLMLANTIPTVDADFYNNPDNDGHIVIYLRNLTNESVHVKAGERIAQGIFEKYLLADNDLDVLPVRRGGIGHTGR